MSIKPATEKEMLKQGFPEELQTAFKETAEETQCVILSRVPGGATTELIAAGHDLKGYFIKAKSCDWGPMSGFLCQVPAFNKKGVEGIEFNAKKNLEYYKTFCDRLHGPQEGPAPSDTSNAQDKIKSIFSNNKLQWQEQWDSPLLKRQVDPIATTRTFLKDYQSDQEAVNTLFEPVPQAAVVLTDDENATKGDNRFKQRLNTAVHDLRTLVGGDSPFVPLKLTKDVFKKFIDSKPGYTQTIGDITCGVAYKRTGPDDSPSFVWFDYIVKKNGALYELYHGNVWVYACGKPLSFEEYVSTKIDIKQTEPIIPISKSGEGKTIHERCAPNGDDVIDRIGTIYKDFALAYANDLCTVPGQDVDKSELFYPIKGIQNYYPPFSGDDAHKNAVTGDYDLFACWPKIPTGGLEDLVRQSELAATGDALFSRMSSKPHSLRSNVSKNVFVEFIPTFEELKGLNVDHPSFGNANGLVHLVAGTLNSFVNTVRPKWYAWDRTPRTVLGRNVAFHGDEGGRPEIDAVDYDVAAFIPKALMAEGSVAKDLVGQEADKKHAQMFLITKHVDLLTLINAVKSTCYVPLNFAWVYDFFNSCEEGVIQLLKALFCTPPKNAKAATDKEKDKQNTEHERLKTKFKSLFRIDQDGKHPPDSEFYAAVGKKIDGFIYEDQTPK